MNLASNRRERSFRCAGPSEKRLVIRDGARISKNNIKSFLFPEVKGSSMKLSQTGNRIDTTLGELIATISDVAFENSHDAKEAYELARVVLVKILKGASLRGEIVDRHFSTSKYLY
jgi:hypothetical protein